MFDLPLLSDEPLLDEEHSYYEECKEFYYITNRPLLSISDEILRNDIEFTSAFLKFGIDEDYDTFNVQEFLTRICHMFHLNRDGIQIKKIQKGSCLIELSINGEKANIKLALHTIYTSLNDKAQEELARLKVFFMHMGKDVKSLVEKQKFRKEIKLHPNYNRIYGVGHTYWTGPLQDGRDRGKYSYFCPIGWKRYAFYVSDNYHDKFKGWSIGYHGTKFQYGLSILLSGLAPARCAALGEGIYASQSIIYASHPRYAEVKKMESTNESSFFRKGCYVQFVLHCRIHPSNIRVVGPETLGVGPVRMIDPNVTNDTIEWVIDTKGKEIVDFNDPDATIVCTGLMIRVTDNHPGLLLESQWWNWTGYGIAENDGSQQCNIIYE